MLNPVNELVNVPVVVPSVVFKFAIVGLELVPQQTPREVMVAPPSLVIIPPQVAALLVILEIAVVLTVGNAASVVKFSSLP